MTFNPRQPFLNNLRDLFTTPIASNLQLGFILAVAFAFAFFPKLPLPNDWALNTLGLSRGLSIYSDQNFVYPPWGVILLWPFHWLRISGIRVTSVLVIGWLAYKRRWTLLRFIAIILSPYFIWTMIMSNFDVLSLILPILLWETAEGKSWMSAGRSVACLLLLVKPQSGVPMMLYFFWKNRRPIKGLVAPFAVSFLLIVPISALGTPPLVFQWIDNAILAPSIQNLEYWRINNISLTAHTGFIPGLLIAAASLGGIYLLIRYSGHPWTQQHTYASIFAATMFIGPYTSNQGLIAPLALVASWPAVLIQYVVLNSSRHILQIDIKNSAWWALLLVTTALWFYKPASDEQ